MIDRRRSNNPNRQTIEGYCKYLEANGASGRAIKVVARQLGKVREGLDEHYEKHRDFDSVVGIPRSLKLRLRDYYKSSRS